MSVHVNLVDVVERGCALAQKVSLRVEISRA